MNSRSLLRIAMCSILTLTVHGSIIGCGGPEGPLRVSAMGTVTLDGVPLKSGQIRFIPVQVEQGPAAATLIQDGAFEFEDDRGPVLGEHRVEIEATDFQGFEIDDEEAFGQRAEKTRGVGIPQNPVPKAYNVHSTLKETVSANGPNSFLFDLKSSRK